MTIPSIINTLEQLKNLHQQLLAVSIEKTEYLKTGEMDRLQALVLKERKLMQDITKLESEREKLASKWFSENSLSTEDATVTNMLEQITDPTEKQALESTTVELMEVIIKLKQQENLNEQLIHQSIQYVHLSLDLINPTTKNVNYSKKDQVHTGNRSLFDSKA